MNTHGLIDVISGAASDLVNHADDPGVVLLVADRLNRLTGELMTLAEEEAREERRLREIFR